jgi:hypothetical protein
MPAQSDDFLWGHPRSSTGTLDKVVGLALFGAACLASLVALIGVNAACLNYEGQQAACYGRSAEWALYFALSLAGLGAASVALHFAFRGPRRIFIALVTVALIVYGASVLFADAGTHGWHDLKVFAVLE